jgi:ubiquinone/menaquinone biosynthesis C-methylase UbiE
VRSVLAVEPDASLRGDAERAARDAGVPVPVTVVAGRAEALPARDREYDAAVLSLVLCSIDDPAPALDEVARALVPGGVLRFYEHVGSAHRPLRLLERLVNLVWSRLAGGCHLDWDSVAAIRDAGFEITTLESFAFSGVTHVLGEARTPGAR